tara:strand:+ start:100 stop:234 length:135 start_codon:yes stop_codon:yes gene_type:complete
LINKKRPGLVLIQEIFVFPGLNCPGWDKPGAYFLPKGGKTEKDV